MYKVVQPTITPYLTEENVVIQIYEANNFFTHTHKKNHFSFLKYCFKITTVLPEEHKIHLNLSEKNQNII